MAQPASRHISAVWILLTPACMDPGETSTDLSPRWSHHFACSDPVRKQVVSSSFATHAAAVERLLPSFFALRDDSPTRHSEPA
jgi:hypothetical protein